MATKKAKKPAAAPAAEIQGDGSGVASPIIVDRISISINDLLCAITDYIIDSKAGDVMSYRDTAALDVATAAALSTEHLWEKLKSRQAQESLDLQPGVIMELAPATEMTITMPTVVFDAYAARDLTDLFIKAAEGGEVPASLRIEVTSMLNGILFARNMATPQNGHVRLGRDSTGEQVDLKTYKIEPEGLPALDVKTGIAYDDPPGSDPRPTAEPNPNDAYFA